MFGDDTQLERGPEIKEHSEMFERGMRSFGKVATTAQEQLLGAQGAATQIATLRKAAIADKDGTALGRGIKALEPGRTVA